MDTDEDLKERFVLYLRDRSLSLQLQTSETYATKTYSELLTRAQGLHGSAMMVNATFNNKPSSNHQVSSVQQPSTATGRINAVQDPAGKRIPNCFFCKKDGHVVKECRLRQKAIAQVQSNPEEHGLLPGRGGASADNKQKSSQRDARGQQEASRGRGANRQQRGRGRGRGTSRGRGYTGNRSCQDHKMVSSLDDHFQELEDFNLAEADAYEELQEAMSEN